jgi:hypothetical protein
MMKHTFAVAIAASSLLLAAWGAPALPKPDALAAPTPIEGTTGKYMSPFTSDGVTAGWVTKAMSVAMGAKLGGMAGQYAGQKAMEQVPFVGGMFGKSLGQKMGSAAALEAIGGAAVLTDTSDLSFNSLNEMAVYMYVNYSTHPEYAKILKATSAIYPQMDETYTQALYAAAKTN